MSTAWPNYTLVVIAFAIFAIYVIALPYLLGVATFAFLVQCRSRCSRRAARRRWMPCSRCALRPLLSLAFEGYLQVLLPRGAGLAATTNIHAPSVECSTDAESLQTKRRSHATSCHWIACAKRDVYH